MTGTVGEKYSPKSTFRNIPILNNQKKYFIAVKGTYTCIFYLTSELVFLATQSIKLIRN